MNLFIKYPTILFIAQSFISFSPVAQTSNPTSSSAAAAYYLEGNMMEANMQYGREGLKQKGLVLKEVIREKLVNGTLF